MMSYNFSRIHKYRNQNKFKKKFLKNSTNVYETFYKTIRNRNLRVRFYFGSIRHQRFTIVMCDVKSRYLLKSINNETGRVNSMNIKNLNYMNTLNLEKMYFVSRPCWLQRKPKVEKIFIICLLLCNDDLNTTHKDIVTSERRVERFLVNCQLCCVMFIIVSIFLFSRENLRQRT